MIREITKKEFESKFPDSSTCVPGSQMPVYLENGEILIAGEWNGEEYIVNGKHYRPVQEAIECGEDGEPIQWEVVGYEEF